MTPKHFTLDEANRTLPLVSRIVSDIVSDYEAWKEALRQYEVVAARDRADQGESEDASQLRLHVDDVAQRINMYIEELKQIGCVLKGFDDGLVDFLARREGRDIFLCWKLGEECVAHWHETDDGFGGRQPLTVSVAEGAGDGPC